ncbi:MAG: cytochrome P450 [Bryobacterales bacterium]|nr:cytochrome P450 [Bryobacterales bacterium]
MRFAEELLLLLHSDNSGYFVPIPEWRMSCALAGGVLLDLSLEDRIDSDLKSLILVDPTPTGDSLLDPALEDITGAEASGGGSRSPQYWVERLAQRADEISDEAISRLVRKGIFESDAGGFWTLSKKVTRTGRYPLVDGSAGEEIRSRIFRILIDGEMPGPRDLAIIGLVHYCDGFRAILEPDEYDEAENLIELYSGIDLIARAIALAVRSSYRPPESMRAARRRPLPGVSLWDMVSSKSFRAGNLPKFMAEKRKELGPVFRLKVPGRKIVVLAGIEANRWVSRKGRFYLRTRDYLEDFQTEWGAARSIASLDGADHFRMRRTVRAGTSRRVVEDRLDELFALGRHAFGGWGLGRAVRGEMACQRLIGQQIARLSASIEPSDVLDDLLKFEYRALLVHTLRLLPRFALRTPRMRRYKKRVLALYAQIHASHTPGQREGKRRDLVDDLMDLHYADPQFLPETDLGFAFIAPLIAGHYLGSAMAFAIYELIKNPGCRGQITAEADALFANGDPTAEALDPAAMDATHRFAMEVLRLHPVIPVHMRTAMNAFAVEGIEVPAYSTVLVAFPATHYMAEHFPEPDRFDIDRYLEHRNEHRQVGAYAPFGVGTHVCGGQGWTRLQMAANLLLIARHLEMELVPRDYRLQLSPLPKVSPDKSFKFRVSRYRHPIGSGG